ncbi:uncharacterized protein LOC106056363 isoform X3 [Biomphalaria glabrata]|uniref:rRNA adenine N(6)-methyltransferase n=2 Tax=Biomphalaria glabrata TaxID=6526 RepID=A0A9W2ZZG5_BIOGL|nr:uncharacterized protein LOC106056363 isoform X3 [Biomphalaria glabrata]
MMTLLEWAFKLNKKTAYPLYFHCTCYINYCTEISTKSAVKLWYKPKSAMNNTFLTTHLGCLFKPNSGALAKKLHIFQSLKYSSNKIIMKSSLSNETNNIKNKLLSYEKFKTLMKKIKTTYVLDQEIAEKIVACVMKKRSNPKAPVIEINCGPGLISQEFLKQGVSKMVVVETNHIFFPFIKDIVQQFGQQRIHHFNWSMLSLYLKLHISETSVAVADYKKSEQAVVELLQCSSTLDQTVSPYCIFSLGGKEENNNLVFYIVRNMPNDDIIISKDLVEFFFLVHPRFQQKILKLGSIPGRKEQGFTGNLTERKDFFHFNSIHVILHLLYDLSFIQEFEANDFIPPFNTTKRVQDKDIDTTKRVLLKLQLKKNINTLLPLEHHIPFLIFLRQLYKKKKTRTIPAMEMLIPGCGLRMIYEGFTMMDLIMTTRPEYFLQLFKAMLKWPEYETSPLKQHIILKSTGGIDQKDLEEE